MSPFTSVILIKKLESMLDQIHVLLPEITRHLIAFYSLLGRKHAKEEDLKEMGDVQSG